MTVPQHPQRLMAYADGELSGAEVVAVEDHLQSCPRCQREVESLRWLQMRTGQSTPAEPDSSLWPVLQARLSSRSVGTGRASWASTAFLILLALGVGAWAGWTAGTGERDEESNTWLASSSLFGDPQDGVSTVYLEGMDDSEVRP